MPQLRGPAWDSRFPSARSTAKMRSMKSILRQRFIVPASVVEAAPGRLQDGWLGNVRTRGYAYVS